MLEPVIPARPQTDESLASFVRRRFGQEMLDWMAALGYLVNGPVLNGLIDLGRLTLVILYDDRVGRGPITLRLAGFGHTFHWRDDERNEFPLQSNGDAGVHPRDG